MADADFTNMPLLKAVTEALGGQLELDDFGLLEMASLESGLRESVDRSTREQSYT